MIRGVQQEPKLHRFVNVIRKWIVAAARMVLEDHGDAARLWNDEPTATAYVTTRTLP